MNFGDHSFAYTEGHTQCDVADMNRGDSLEEIVALFKLLPFHPSNEDKEEEVKEKETKESDETNDVKHEPLSIGPPTVLLELSLPEGLSCDHLIESCDCCIESCHMTQYNSHMTHVTVVLSH